MERREEDAARQEPEWERMYHTGTGEGAAPSPEGRDRQVVLVVEDDPNDWEIYGKILWYNGFDVLCAANGVKGLKLAREYRPDLILLDLGLPGMSGIVVPTAEARAGDFRRARDRSQRSARGRLRRGGSAGGL